jgi:hypothetical protein
MLKLLDEGLTGVPVPGDAHRIEGVPTVVIHLGMNIL